jgi:hypothetical protein
MSLALLIPGAEITNIGTADKSFFDKSFFKDSFTP